MDQKRVTRVIMLARQGGLVRLVSVAVAALTIVAANAARVDAQNVDPGWCVFASRCARAMAK